MQVVGRSPGHLASLAQRSHSPVQSLLQTKAAARRLMPLVIRTATLRRMMGLLEGTPILPLLPREWQPQAPKTARQS